MATKAQKRIQAAALLGQGRTRNSVAAELDIDPATISRWRRDENFRALEQKARDEMLAARPTVRATLEAALGATRPSKSGPVPDWPTRVAAARTLLGASPDDLDAEAAEPVVVTRRIFVDRETGEEREAATA